MKISKKYAFKDILKNLREENVAIFAGAGLSKACGYVDWNELLKPIAQELELDINKEDDLVTLAQYHCNVFSSRSKINQILVDEFSDNGVLSENHRVLSRLPIETYWTTNYDKLIEKSLEEAGKKSDVKYSVNQLAITKYKRDAVVYKMHGDADHPDKAILTKDDYESYTNNMQPFLTALAGDLVSKTFLFIGFSFTDPNLDYILSRVRITYNDNQRRHYCFLRKIKRKEGESIADFEYRERKQELFIEDLKRYSILAVLIDEYREITDFLKELEKAYRCDTVFISGAAHEYGDWGKRKSEEFIYNLSKKLINNDFKIVSGFGLGIGSAIISGALEEIYNNLTSHSKDDLILKPFSQSTEAQQYKEKYREDIISYAGIAIFVFGNKLEDGELVLSSGMEQEFEIAKRNGLILLPIGITGYITKVFYEEICSNFDKYYSGFGDSIKDYFLELNDETNSPDEVIKSVLNILRKVKGV